MMHHRCLIGSRVAAVAAVWGMALLASADGALAGALATGPYLCFDRTETSPLQTPFTGTCTADSPYAASVIAGSFGGPGSYFHLETVEDSAINTPGLSAVGASIVLGGSLVDSVDADDGSINGLAATTNRSIIGTGATGITMNFNAGVLGALPTAVGVVWTDGIILSKITFEAYTGNNKTGTLLGSIVVDNQGDATNARGTAEDLFFGWTDPGGIGSFWISNVRATSTPSGPGTGIEIDHVQYGRQGASVAEPTPLLLLAVGLAALLARRRWGHRSADC